jgi:hypothetical protein
MSNHRDNSYLVEFVHSRHINQLIMLIITEPLHFNSLLGYGTSDIEIKTLLFRSVSGQWYQETGFMESETLYAFYFVSYFCVDVELGNVFSVSSF